MRKSLYPIAILAVLGMTGAALANESNGTIKMIDQTARTVTLEDGSVYLFPNEKNQLTELQGYKVGDHVKITWSEPQGSENDAPRDASLISGMAG